MPMMHIGTWYKSNAGLVVFRIGSEVTEGPGFLIDRPNGSTDHDFIHFTTPALVRIGDRELRVEPDACILYSPGFPQWYTGLPKRSFTHDWFHFEGKDQHTHVERFGPPVNTVFYTTRSRYITDMVRQIYFEVSLQAECWQHGVESLVRTLLVSLRRSARGEKPAASDAEERLRRMRVGMHKAPERPWDVSQMARECSLSRSRFSVLFKRYFGATPMAEIIHIRLHRARHLLTTTSWSVDRVARECGFTDPAYFNRLFKKKLGVTPGQYR